MALLWTNWTGKFGGGGGKDGICVEIGAGSESKKRSWNLRADYCQDLGWYSLGEDWHLWSEGNDGEGLAVQGSRGEGLWWSAPQFCERVQLLCLSLFDKDGCQSCSSCLNSMQKSLLEESC